MCKCSGCIVDTDISANGRDICMKGQPRLRFGPLVARKPHGCGFHLLGFFIPDIDIHAEGGDMDVGGLNPSPQAQMPYCHHGSRTGLQNADNSYQYPVPLQCHAILPFETFATLIPVDAPLPKRPCTSASGRHSPLSDRTHQLKQLLTYHEDIVLS